MAAVDDPKTFGRARLGFENRAEIDEFADVLAQFERGDITPDQWRAFRLVRGTYGQRQSDDAQMLRVKVPQGILSSGQLQALADVADRYSRGFAHITTRQNVQFHFMKLHDVEPAMRRLADEGLTTREACGNSVRNITACPYAGVSADEVFDVTPYSEAMTRHLLRHPLSSKLPRKFKIAFEGCPGDHARLGINDLGFKAATDRDGGPGFRVTVAGGTSILPRSGTLLHEFVPATAIFDVADAVIRTFAEFGDYQHKQRNRLKFLVRNMGWERWRDEYDRALVAIRSEASRDFPFDPASAPVQGPAPRSLRLVPGTVTPSTDAFARWRATNVVPQKQPGYAVAIVTVPLGDVTSAQFRVLADLANAFGDGTAVMTLEQNLVFRWIAMDTLPRFYRAIEAAGFGLPGAGSIADVVSCPGAESCRLAVTQSRGLGRLLGDHLRSNSAITAAAGEADIKISGCPNGCGQHHIAAIGFQGSIRRVGGRAVPQYFVMAGGGSDADGAAFGRVVAKIPARRCAEAVDRLVALYSLERANNESLAEFLRAAEPARLKALLEDLEHITESDARPEDFVDLGEDQEFAPQVMDGECSA